MCGIVGIIAENSADLINEATEKIAHRGPDSWGTYTFKNTSFGHRRLAIVDLSENGQQPMFSADGRYVLIFNGEIYNHTDFLEPLKAKHTFKSTSDTETLLYALIEYGTAILPKLNGIFAFAFLDTHTGDLLLVRDHFGIKPLYYFHQNDVLYFASELKAIAHLPKVSDKLNPTSLVNYLYYLYSPGQDTPLQDIKKLLPGHYLSTNINHVAKIELCQFYEIPFKGVYSQKTEAQLLDELDQRLCKAVERQLLADTPVGFFLSGGLDSSAVVAMARKITGKKLTCFTIDSGQEKNLDGFADDLHYARKVAKHLDVDLIEIDGKMNIIDQLDFMVYHLDEPQADLAPLHIYNICKAARANGFKVLLGGTAGDDLFSGYRKHQALTLEPFYEYLPKPIAQIINQLVGVLPSNHATVRRLKKLLAQADKDSLSRMAGYYGWIQMPEILGLFTEVLRQELANYDPQEILKNALKAIPNEKNNLNQMLFWDMKYFLTDHNLNYTDKLSMAAGVETRVPFLDIELVEFSTTIPTHLKMKGKTTKYLLKKVMERYLPKDVIYRPKTGFGSPVRTWLINDWEAINARFPMQKNLAQQQIFDPQAVATLISQNQKGQTDASYTLLSLLMIDSWIRQFR